MPSTAVEICFDGDVADLVEAVEPAAQVSARLTCTILSHRQTAADDLDRLLDELSQFGIAPLAVHRCADDRQQDACEVVVPGRLGRVLLHHLGWSYQVGLMTVVRLSVLAGPAAVLDALGSRVTVRYVLCD